MALFWADSIALCYADVAAARRWWIQSFGCKETAVPEEWDCRLPSDVALQFPGESSPTVVLSDRAEVELARFERSNGRPVVFCRKLTKAREHLQAAGAGPGDVQHSGGTDFFEVRDTEGNVIEVCREP